MRWLNTPHELYISTEFRQLRRQLMVERVNDEGLLLCEHCGKPILRDHECIAHHKTEVTINNLNDPAITLNPQNILLVHHQCHNAIHDRFGYAQKRVYVVWGSPCSGKSSFVMQNKGRNDLLIDIDLLWRAITGGEKYDKPDALKAQAFALRECLLDSVKTRAGKWATAYYVTSEPRKAARDRLCARLGAEPIYIPCTRAEALERLANDPERKGYEQQWAEYINRFFDEMEGDDL
ncbi:MAG: hypothetical protein IIV05_07870 [Ruminococcus sp.]|nr:hypothetical protein [Ruminococcus sp.]